MDFRLLLLIYFVELLLVHRFSSLFLSKGVTQADQNLAGSQEGSENVLIKIISFLSAKNDLKTILARGVLCTANPACCYYKHIIPPIVSCHRFYNLNCLDKISQCQ